MSNMFGNLQPWQVFHIARKHLGPGSIAKVFGKSNVRSAYDWAQDPLTTQKRCRSPLEALHHMFQLLDEIGLGYVARASIAYLQTAIEPDELHNIQEPLPTIEQEILADYSAVASLQRAVEACEEVDLVDTLKQEAIDEIERTYAKYLKDCA